MGAPGLAFETWDPSRKCRQTAPIPMLCIRARLLVGPQKIERYWALKPSLAQALCGTAEAVHFVWGPSFSAEVVPYVLHFSTPTWFRNRGSQHQLDQ
jgi:hypothetical protein